MTRPGGANARTLEAFALGRELRVRRIRTGLSPKDLSNLAAIQRNKLDALELGDISPASRKKAGRWRREELLRLAFLPQLEFSDEELEGFVALAHDAGVLGPWERYSPITRREWLAAGRQRPASASHDARQLAEAILNRHRTDYLRAATGPAPTEQAARDWETPAQRCRVLYGRDQEIAELSRRLCDPGRPHLVLVAGLPGSGKSELARAVASLPGTRRAFRRCVWISVRPREFLVGGSVPSSALQSAEIILQRIARSLRCTVAEIARVMSSEPSLVVVDNTEAVSDEEDLLSQLAARSGVGKILVTSRRWYAASFIDPFPPDGRLPGLTRVDAEKLLVEEAQLRGGSAASQLTREAVRKARLWELSGGIPLVLHWIVGRSLRTELGAIIAELSSGQAGDLDGFMFARAWRELSPPSREVLSFLVEAASEPVPAELMSLARVAGDELAAALDELRASGFVEPPSDGASEWGVHPLLAAFAHEQLAGTKKRRWTAASAWRPALEHLRLGLADDRRGAGAATPLGSLANYIGWMRAAVAAGAAPEAIVAWTKLSRYLWEHWHWDLYEACTEVGQQAIELLAKTSPLGGAMLRGLVLADTAYLRFEQSRLDEALEAAAAARSIFATLDDDAGLGIAARYEALIRLRRRDPVDQAREAIVAALEAVGRARERGHPLPGSPARRAVRELTGAGLWEIVRGGYRSYRGELAPAEAELHAILGEVFMRDRRFEEAATTLEESIRLYVNAPERWPGSEAGPMIALAECLVELGEHERRRALLDQALAVARRAERRDLEAGALLRLAHCRMEASEIAQATALAREALEIHSRLGQADGIREAAALISRFRRAPTVTKASGAPVA